MMSLLVATAVVEMMVEGVTVAAATATMAAVAVAGLVRQ